MEQQGYEEELFRRWFPKTVEGQIKPLTEKDIRGIADVLTRSSRERWSRIPRLYSILRKIDQLDIIDAFIDNDITDVFFPFSKSTLPEVLRDHSARLKFLELQHLVYNTEALSLEQNARHGHFSDSTEVPLKKVGELGKGGFGYVDRVVSTISHEEYARKLISRGRTFNKDKQILKDFTKELSNLKRLSHRHLVNLVGSYTDRKFVAIIMLPIADTNLQAFLERPDLGDQARSLLRPFFGCLTSALCYLHDSRIRHKDIKPSNVLVKDDKVYLTDFGTSFDWSEHDNSTTATARPTTRRYCSPEVMAYADRNSSSDVWSLGCVFLEMWTVLKHRTLEDLRAHVIAHGTGSTEYHSSPEGISSWVQLLQGSGGLSCDLAPATWIMNMLQQKPALRWNVHTLDDHIREASMDEAMQHVFKGSCCLELDDDISEDVEFSDDDRESLLTDRSGPHFDFGTIAANASPDALSSRQSRGAIGLETNHAPLVHSNAMLHTLPPVIRVSDYDNPPPPWVENERESLAREISGPPKPTQRQWPGHTSNGSVEATKPGIPPLDSDFDSTGGANDSGINNTTSDERKRPPITSRSKKNIRINEEGTDCSGTTDATVKHTHDASIPRYSTEERRPSKHNDRSSKERARSNYGTYDAYPPRSGAVPSGSAPPSDTDGARSKRERTDRKFIPVDSDSDEVTRYEAEYKKRSADEEARRQAGKAMRKAEERRAYEDNRYVGSTAIPAHRKMSAQEEEALRYVHKSRAQTEKEMARPSPIRTSSRDYYASEPRSPRHKVLTAQEEEALRYLHKSRAQVEDEMARPPPVRASSRDYYAPESRSSRRVVRPEPVHKPSTRPTKKRTLRDLIAPSWS